MTVEQQQLIKMHVSILKEIMRKERLVFGILVDEKDTDNSLLAFLDKDSLSKSEKTGIVIGLETLNRGLV